MHLTIFSVVRDAYLNVSLLGYIHVSADFLSKNMNWLQVAVGIFSAPRTDRNKLFS